MSLNPYNRKQIILERQVPPAPTETPPPPVVQQHWHSNWWDIRDGPKQKLGLILVLISMPILVLWIFFSGADRLESFLTAPIGFKPHPPDTIFDWVAGAGVVTFWLGMKWQK